MLPLSVTCVFPANIRIGEEMPDVVLNFKFRKLRLKGPLKTRAFRVPKLGILDRVERE
jgi:hypothetical protein